MVNRQIETRVGMLAVVDEGAGEPVVMWPSLFSDHRLFDLVVTHLGADWRTLRVDGPGFGQSTPPSGEVQAHQYADAVIDLLDALRIEQAFVAGCSWGGQVSAHVAARAPDRTRGALLMNTALEPSLGGHRLEVLGTRWFGSTATWGRGVARSFFSPTTRLEHPDRVRAFVSRFGSFRRKPAATTVRTVLTRSAGLGDVLPKLSVPVAILAGADDPLCPVDQLLPQASRVSHGHVEIIPSCGHLAPLEAPERVADALRSLARGA